MATVPVQSTTAEPLTIPYTELPAPGPDDPLAQEWNTYRREAAHLLAAGHEGRHVLIKGEQIIGIWDKHEEALAAGYRQFLGESFLVHHIQQRERLVRCRSVRLCQNTPIQ
jgi:hypothetical protein